MGGNAVASGVVGVLRSCQAGGDGLLGVRAVLHLGEHLEGVQDGAVPRAPAVEPRKGRGVYQQLLKTCEVRGSSLTARTPEGQKIAQCEYMKM